VTRRLCLLAALAAMPAAAQTSAWSQQFGGYFKDLASASRSYFTDEAWADNLVRLRLTYNAKYGSWFEAHVDYDNELHAGNLIGLPDFGLIRDRQNAAWLPLKHTIVDEPHFYWDTSLYRGFVSLRSSSTTLTLGRQRIGWGTARFWSPMDMFNPISPLQIEADERQGVDAALVQTRTPGELRWSAVYAPQNGFRRSASAVRLSRTIHNYDFDAVAARFAADWVAGVDFAGQVRGAGVRGELTYRWRHPVSGVVPIATKDALRFVVGADYAFANSLYLVAEYFYNQGQPDIAPGQALNPGVLLQFSSEIFTLRRHFLSGGATYDITPLWKVESYAVADLTGPSVVVLPRLSHSLTANTDLNIGAQLFASATGGEFHGISNLVYAEVVVHFP
jgi:hypothetical protein